jgi:hypothetical protein
MAIDKNEVVISETNGTKVTVKKQLTQEELEAQMVARINRELELKQAQREENKCTMGARCMAKRVQNGSPIIDKQTQQQKIDGNGVALCYPDKYYVTLQFMGGELEKEVRLEQFEDLEEFKTYYCEGYIGEVKKFGNSFIEPIFTKFTKI